MPAYTAKAAKCVVPGFEAGPPVARCGVCRRLDGPARTVHRRRTWPRRRPVHAAPLRGAGRERAAADLGANEGGAAIRKASGGKLGNPSNIRQAGEIGRTALIEAADDHAKNMLP